nr:hypothetical protein RTCK_02929 [Rhizobium sp. TCK]
MNEHIPQTDSHRSLNARIPSQGASGPQGRSIPYRANLLGNIEQALKGLQGYGIMALELIQNADDARATNLSFDARDDALIVDNAAVFSSCGMHEPECPWLKIGDPEGLHRPCNFHAIAEMGSRSKIQAPDQIGRFGIGFVSVYQVTDTPIVRSGGIELQLNPQTQEVMRSDIPPFPGTQFVLPWAGTASEVRIGLNASPTPPDVADKVVLEISQVLKSSLLFLRHVKQVELRRNGELVAEVVIDRSAEEVRLEFKPSGEVQHWLVLSRTADDVLQKLKLVEKFEALGRLDRSKTVSVAVPLHSEQVGGLLYAYLPTRQATGMPVHVNGDFFPHASRQAIVLEGEQHDRYWNEALLATAASALAENFVRVRDLLGPIRFWTLAHAAFQRKGEHAFKAFWERLGEVVSAAPSVWSAQDRWCIPNQAALPPEAMTALDQQAIAALGLPLIHADIRPFWSVLSSVGSQQLRLSMVVTAFEEGKHIEGGAVLLRKLWSAIELLIGVSGDRSGLPAVLARLKAVEILLDVDNRPVSANGARNVPADVSVRELLKVIPTCSVVHPDVLSFPSLSALVDEYLLDDLAVDLAEIIVDEASAEAAIGGAEADIRRFYGLLTAFPRDRGSDDVAETLRDVPILRTGAQFVSPSRGQLPGDFRDPIGHFQVVDVDLFVRGMWDFAKEVLEVDVLTFRRYVEDHLEALLRDDLTREQYCGLMREVLNHRSQLDEDGTLRSLANVPFVRTRTGQFVKPNEAYFWTAPLSLILGEEPSRWVDESWFPDGGRAKDLLEHLGMPFSVAPQHIVDRIESLAESGAGLDAIVKGTTPIIRHILDRWSRFDEDDRSALSGLSEISFLTAIVDGKLDEGQRYTPTGVYRAGRAAGFASQVPIVEMTPLRQSTSVVNEFLDLIDMPSEPPTEDVVAHLEHCMASDLPVHDLTYQILSERLEDDDADCIDRLFGTDFIHFADVGFIGADEVFWAPPPFGGYWHSASNRMRQRDQLYRRLGVVDSPEPRHYAALALKIADSLDISAADVAVHGRCIAAMAEALEREEDGAAEAVDLLAGEVAFLNVDGDAISTDEAIWLDSQHLADAFGSELNDRLFRLADTSRSASTRLLKRLDILALSDIAQFRLAEPPDGNHAAGATALLRERIDLLLWLAPNRATRLAMNVLLQRLELSFSKRLLVHAEIDAFDPPVCSPPSAAPAFLDQETTILHLRAPSGNADWVAAFRAIFAAVERHCPSTDIPPLCLTAAYIMSFADRSDAEQALLTSDYKPPMDGGDEFKAGQELQDEVASDEVEEVETSDDSAEAAPFERQNGSEEDVLAEDLDASFIESESEAATDPTQEDSQVDVGQMDVVEAVESDAASDHTDDEDLDFDEEYGSATSRDEFGADRNEAKATAGGGSSGGSGGIGRESDRTGGERGGAATGTAPSHSGATSTKEAAADRQARRSRMLSYVARSGARGDGDAAVASGTGDLSDQIDAAAMKAALRYEEARGWVPERQPHFNPGFDIASKSPGGERRLIEVKGLENEWTERGIKLSHVQFSMAREHPGEFWIYVVEHARDLERQRVTAIGNPFSKVDEYWFDHNWREMSEERASAREIHLKVGLQVEHHFWKKGTIVEIKSRGAIPFVVVDFGRIEGRRGLPFNAELKIID